MKCKHCGKELRTFNYVTEDDEPLCDDCFYKYYETCRECQRAIPKGTNLCQACSERVFNKILNSYGTKVTNRYGNKKDNVIKCLNDRYFGLEMEYNHFRPANARVLFSKQYNDKLIYNKSDSSISSGVEIVTIPLVKSKVLKLIDDMDLSRIKSTNGSKVENGAGLHIHVSRNTITPIAVHRLSLLFNSAWSRPYKMQVYYLVGRSDCTNSISNSDSYFRVGSQSVKDSMYDDRVASHGVAINLGNKHTVEFRLFKATRDCEQLKSYLEFTELAIQFAETQPLKMMSLPNFFVYLYLNATNSWLKDRLETLKQKEPELFKIKEKQFTLDYYMSKFKDMGYKETYNMINEIRETVASNVINWDVDKIDNKILNKWQNDSCGMGTSRDNKILGGLIDKIKNEMVDKILAK